MTVVAVRKDSKLPRDINIIIIIMHETLLISRFRTTSRVQLKHREDQTLT